LTGEEDVAIGDALLFSIGVLGRQTLGKLPGEGLRCALCLDASLVKSLSYQVVA